MTTEEIIANQLAENTGRAMMDSGDYYGRAWQRNQARAEAAGLTILESFQAESVAWWDGYSVTISAFHWMTEHLDHRPDLQSRFDRWINLSWIGLDRYERGNETNSMTTVDTYIDLLIKHKWAEPHPEFDGWTNTYNHENLLSQDLQFLPVELTDKHPLGEASVVFLSTHNGCDARGGYSDYKIYECDPWELWDWDTFTVHCPQCEQHPDDPSNTLFDQSPYVHETYGYWHHRGGDWDTDIPNVDWNMEPIFDPKYDKTPDGFELPDDFEQTGPICPIHYCNMEVN